MPSGCHDSAKGVFGAGELTIICTLYEKHCMCECFSTFLVSWVMLSY